MSCGAIRLKVYFSAQTNLASSCLANFISLSEKQIERTVDSFPLFPASSHLSGEDWLGWPIYRTIITPTAHLRFLQPDNCLAAFHRIINGNLHDWMGFLDMQPHLLRLLQSCERIFGLSIYFQAEPLKRWFGLANCNLWRGFLGGTCFCECRSVTCRPV